CRSRSCNNPFWKWLSSQELAVVDSDSFRVEAYLEETKLNFVRVGDSATVIYAFALFLLSTVSDRTTSYRIHSASRPRCSTDLSLRGTAVFLEGLTPSKTAGMSWRPSMPGPTKRLTSSTT